MRLDFGGHARATPLPLPSQTPAGDRLRVPLTLTATITEFTVTGAGVVSSSQTTEPVTRDVDLYGPRDVVRLAPGAIVRSSPPDGAGDVDGEFCVFVEFGAADLPWRYSPRGPQGDRAVPWLALVAGVEGQELGLDPDGTAWMSAGLTTSLDPACAAAWAHTQGAPPTLSRLLCPRRLDPGRRCLAAVVSLLDDRGEPRWRPGRPVRGLPVHHQFRFTTNDAGTFEDLVAALDPTPAPVGLGEAVLHADGLGAPATAAMFGALAPVAAPPPAPLDPATVTEVAGLLEPIPEPVPGEPAPQPVLGAPRYSLPFRWDASAPWVSEVDADPRHRAAAGIGARVAVDWQERIMTAAASRLGQTHHAAGLLRHLTAGVAFASRADAHRPTDPAGLVAFFGPALGTITSATGGTALTHVCPPGRPLPPALLSSAAAHLLRASGPTAKTSAEPDAVATPGTVVAEALHCPDPPSNPVHSVDPIAGEFDLERALALLRDAGLDVEPEDLRGLLGRRPRQPREEPEEPCGEPGEGWVGEAAGALTEAFRPDDVPVRRVVDRIQGLHEPYDVPLEVRPDLDLPVWDWLRRRTPEWLLPRAGLIPRDGIVALRTNRAFIAACLLGASRQAVGELRWRGVPVAAGAMPMRTFWQHVASPENPPPMVDLVQPSSWPAVPLDALPGARGAGDELVIAIRSDLVRRYPDTVIYLAPPTVIDGIETADTSRRIAPAFAGRIEPNVWFFGFPVAPSRLAELVLVLEEPDRGPRFHPPSGAQAGAYTVTRPDYATDGTSQPLARSGLADGGRYAEAAYANPIRAICDGQLLLSEDDR